MKVHEPFLPQFLQNPVGVDGGDADAIADVLLGERDPTPAGLYQPDAIRTSMQFAQ